MESPAAPAAPAASPIPADFRVRLARATDRFTSRGHGERFDAILWFDEAARPALKGGRSADGATLIEEAIVREIDGDRPAGLLVMQRKKVWRFYAIEPDGTVVSDERVAACAACHAEAPDYVFPLPR